MFQHHITAFGRFEKHTFSHSEKPFSFSIVPAFGAVLLEHFFDGINVIDGFQSAEELEAFHWAKSAVLYPFPNRLRDGQFTHLGKTFQFPIDNAATQNAIHGIGKKMEHHIEAISLDEEYVSVTCVNEYDGHLPQYPFPCRFEITFNFSEAHGMYIIMSLENTGKKIIPAGLGWHPYFKISEKIEDCFLQLPDLQLIEIDERMLPTGKKENYTSFLTMEKINDTMLDNGFYIPNQAENAVIQVASEQGVLSYWQETGHQKCNFVQIFTPPHRTCIAIEPMTCNIDAFNSQDGVVLLAANEKLTAKFGYHFEKINKKINYAKT